MDSEPVMVSECRAGDFSGEEKMPEMGSKPLSSRTPRSSSVIPVFLSLWLDARAKVMDLFCSPSLNTNIIVRVLAIFALPLGWRHVWKARALELSAWWGCTNASVVLLWGREGVVTVCLDAPSCCLGIATAWTNHAEHNTSLKSPTYVNEPSCLIVHDMCLVNNVCRALPAPHTLPYTPRHQFHSSHE
jgi:hypothetical protein